MFKDISIPKMHLEGERSEERGGLPEELCARMHRCILCGSFVGGTRAVTYKRGDTQLEYHK